MRSGSDVFCRGLFLSARWFVLSQVAEQGMHVVVLPNREAAEYCAADLYHLVEGDRVFFLPESGRNVERSNYKSTLGVQRTAAIGKILGYAGDLLSWVMSHATAGDAWVTIMSNINVAAVASLTEVACVIFAASNPAKAYLAALMFGFFDAIGLRLQAYISSDLTSIIPYAITIIMMTYVVVNTRRKREKIHRKA